MKNEILTIDMIDIIWADLRIVRLLPAQGQLVADAVRERLGLCVSGTMIISRQYLEHSIEVITKKLVF